jgi:hypothetical protein
MMNRVKWLKVVNAVLFILILWQALTGLARDSIPQEVFEILHPTGGLVLVVFAMIHLYLNWGWVKSVYFEKTAEKQ